MLFMCVLFEFAVCEQLITKMKLDTSSALCLLLCRIKAQRLNFYSIRSTLRLLMVEGVKTDFFQTSGDGMMDENEKL